jgi:hypothetical protein
MNIDTTPIRGQLIASLEKKDYTWFFTLSGGDGVSADNENHRRCQQLCQQWSSTRVRNGLVELRRIVLEKAQERPNSIR